MVVLISVSQTIENVCYTVGDVVNFPEDTTVDIAGMVSSGLLATTIPDGSTVIQHIPAVV